MTVTFTAACPECEADATWTSSPMGTGNAPPVIDCPCKPTTDRTE